jgi:hypothetical protein
LLYVQLLKLNPAVIQGGTKHHRFGGAIAPGKPGQFAPKRRGHQIRLGKVSAKSEVTSVEQTANAIGESECFRSLLKRYIGSSAGNFPVGMFGAPFVRNVSADFSSERVSVELQSDALISQARQVRRSGLQIEAMR